MASTPIYSWPTPDNTGLVKNGALDMRTLGNAIDTTMATMTPKSLVDAKGDLVTATANDTPARLAVGANGETLVADSSTATGLRYTGNFAAGKNKIINGDFGIWQRGTSSTTNGTFLADRWYFAADGSGSTNTVSQQTFTPGTAPVSGYEGNFFWRLNRSAIGSGNTYNILEQKIEDVRTFAGQTITVSYWAKADSTRTTGATTFYQNFGSGGSTQVSTQVSASQSLTTSWQRFSTTITLPSVSGKTIGAGSYLAIDIGLCFNSASTTDIWGVQIEAGSTATAFQTATGTIQGELAACQRYFQKTYSQATAPATTTSIGSINGTNSGTTLIIGLGRLPVVMRTEPTITLYSSATGATGKVRSGGADVNATVADVGDNGIGYLSATGLSAGGNSTIHYAASSEL